MKIAIHQYHLSNMFTERWIQYCIGKGIEFKVVNCYDSNIIDNILDCDALMWHHNETTYQDKLFAKQLLFAFQQAGKQVFPNFNTGWHFDDKIGQKYLLESIRAPLVPTHVFYSKEDALEWTHNTAFPKVFKLRGGSGSRNVKLVKSRKDAVKIIKKAFESGFSQFDKVGFLKEKIRTFKSGQSPFFGVVKAMRRLIIAPEFAKMTPREKGYVYFQDFVPNNTFDIRVIVIGDKAFALKRSVRENDFRASGSGKLIYDKEQIDERCIEVAFKVNSKIHSQSIAFDFLFDTNGDPLISEVSYGYAVKPYDPCPGYWDKDLKFHYGQFNPQEWILQQLIKQIEGE